MIQFEAIARVASAYIPLAKTSHKAESKAKV